jgi:hypothetical protein
MQAVLLHPLMQNKCPVPEPQKILGSNILQGRGGMKNNFILKHKQEGRINQYKENQKTG